MQNVTLTGEEFNALIAKRAVAVTERRSAARDFDRLTQSEARYLERITDAVTIRNKIATAE